MAIPNPTPENHAAQPADWAITYCPERDRFLIPKALKGVHGVYLVENTVTGRRYVGSSLDLADRINRHLHKGSRNRLIEQDLREHGRRSFIALVLEEVPTPEGIEMIERVWIERMLPEYNKHQLGGSGHRKQSAETKAKISAANKGRKIQKEAVDRIRRTKSMMGREPTGKPLTEETRRRISESVKLTRERQAAFLTYVLAVAIHWRLISY